MRITAIVGVKDEAEILEDCIAHLKAIGVDRIIAHDAGSTDGSERILASHAGADFVVVQHSDLDPDADAWNRLHADLARNSGADWVLFQDADEFWIPESGHLRECALLRDADILSVPRYNVAVGPGGPLIEGARTPAGASAMQLICKPPENFRGRLESEGRLPWIRCVPVPKIMARPSLIGKLADGEHNVEPLPGMSPRRVEPKDLFIAHLPFTTLPRFARKLANVREVFNVHSDYFGPHIAWHWRRWLSLEDEAAVTEEFRRQVFDERMLTDLRIAEVVKSDRELFASARAGCA